MQPSSTTSHLFCVDLLQIVGETPALGMGFESSHAGWVPTPRSRSAQYGHAELANQMPWRK